MDTLAQGYCGVAVDSPFFLAPMAGITDSAFRTICAGQGAGLSYTEMVSAKALMYQDRKSQTLLAIEDDHRPCAVQLFGSEPQVMAQAAARVVGSVQPQMIDINMGCPVPKIVGNGEGSALMRDPLLAGHIIEAVARAVPVPVTVKFRKGFGGHDNTAVSFAKMCQSAGAAAICVHGRTRSQMYSGQSDRQVIADVKAAVTLPVLASGDAASARDCMDILAQTGCDGVMIARGALGNPFIFAQCRALLAGQPVPQHTADELLDIMVAHVALTCRRKGEGRAMPEIRKHALWYLGRLRGVKHHKAAMSRVSTFADFEALVADIRAGEPQLKQTHTLPQA